MGVKELGGALFRGLIYGYDPPTASLIQQTWPFEEMETHGRELFQQ